MTKTKKNKYQHRDAYLNAALEIVKAHGVEKLTMRKVADYLDVSAMAIYKHFSSKDELLKCLLDEFIEKSSVLPDADLPWPEWIEYVANRMYQALQGETMWLTILGSMNIGDNGLLVTRAFFEKMTNAGFEFRTTLDAFFTMLQLVMGSVILQSTIKRQLAKSIPATILPTPGEKAPFDNLLSRPQISIGISLLIQALQANLES